MKVIFETFSVNSIEELRTTIDFGNKGKVEDEKTKRARLLNMKMNLEIWKLLKDVGVPIKEAWKILNGESEIPEPDLKMLKPQSFQNNTSGLCDFCGHAHTDGSDGKPCVCKILNCTCGVR